MLRFAVALLPAVAAGLLVVASGAAPSLAVVRVSGVSVRLPAGWQWAVARTPQCDPQRLLVASSAPVRIGAGGRLAAPGAGVVTVLVVEDVQVEDRPVGNLRRPRHFTIDWGNLRTYEPDGFCGNPRGAAAVHYVKLGGRYIGLIVHPGVGVSDLVREQTLALLDSLRVEPSPHGRVHANATSRTLRLPAGRATRTFTLQERAGVILLNQVTVPHGMRVVVDATIPRVAGVSVSSWTRPVAPSASCETTGQLDVCTQGEEWCPMPAARWHVRVVKRAGPAGLVRFVLRVAPPPKH